MKLCLSILCFLIYSESYSQKINGISLVSPPFKIEEKMLTPLIETNANWIALSPFAFLYSEKDAAIKYNSDRQWYGETPKGIRESIQLLKKKKRKIMLKPQIWIIGGLFTGDLCYHSEEKWRIFEDSYTKYLIEFAKIAAEENVDMLCIGTELNGLVQSKPDFWTSLIKKVRNIYTGPITYAENWDKIHKVPFWSHLDYIGVDAYFPLSVSKTPSEKELIKKWLTIQQELKKLSTNTDKEILFTEFGYRSIDYTAKAPWDSSQKNKKYNTKGQSNAIRAIYNVFWKEDWFAGGFLWKWFPKHEKAGGINDTSFTIQNKPSQEILKELYQK